MEILQGLDIFSTPISFRIMDDKNYHSLISVSLSLITMISTVLFTYFFGMDFVFHLELNTLQSTRLNKTYEFYKFSMDEFFVAWRIEGTEGNEINETDILHMNLAYYSYKEGYYEFLEYQRCKTYNFSTKLPEDIKNYYCIDMSKFSLGGGWENENKIEYLYFNLNLCNYDEDIGYYNCSTQEDFQNLVNKYNQVYMIIYYPTIEFSPEEDIPYQITYNKKNIALDSRILTQDRFYIRKYIFDDDNRRIAPKINTYKLFEFLQLILHTL